MDQPILRSSTTLETRGKCLATYTNELHRPRLGKASVGLAEKAGYRQPDPQAALEAAKTACQEEARRKGIANMTAILLRRSKTSETAYIECMRVHGFEATQ